jgi:hypothetical protein
MRRLKQRILLGETQCTDILTEKVASNVCWFSGIYISVASAICRWVPGQHLVPQRHRNEITIKENSKQHVLCRPRHCIITTMSECPCNVLRVSVSASTQRGGRGLRCDSGSGACNEVGRSQDKK